jgi:hypothetical protein
MKNIKIWCLEQKGDLSFVLKMAKRHKVSLLKGGEDSFVEDESLLTSLFTKEFRYQKEQTLRRSENARNQAAIRRMEHDSSIQHFKPNKGDENPFGPQKEGEVQKR